ncbi:hypothetical protein [Aquibacillus salsiterrae]|uniref:Uncharacterized protein n=1 Tax=Aquibacillus salsiterrae TaxID=2950439 RepID=A0A9X3WCT4_9BACI|nr:hypothetical protein [Aquibacillus salsiterrae]MDC3417177.1 hypothetical protein [Aquibacillus salsiterrae]
MNLPKKHEALLWSIAFPGFGQFLNGRIIKGIVLIVLEFLVNTRSNFNSAIISSFNGEIRKAVEVTNYQWLMFYPCLYMFALWDAYRDADGKKTPFSYLPFVFGGFFVTVGLIYSQRIKPFGLLFGPVFLPMIFLIPGLFIGFIIYKFALKTNQK